MKKYPNINKHFNLTTKVLYILGTIAVAILYVVLLYIFFSGHTASANVATYKKVISIVAGLYVIWWAFSGYLKQVNLEEARLGKHLTQYHGLKGEALREQIAKIDAEMSTPLYTDASDKNRWNCFFITENWLVGTEGTMLARVNACKKTDVIKVEKKIVDGTRRVHRHYIHQDCYILQVTDKNNFVYLFWLTTQENVDMAYDFLMRDKEEAV